MSEVTIGPRSTAQYSVLRRRASTGWQSVAARRWSGGASFGTSGAPRRRSFRPSSVAECWRSIRETQFRLAPRQSIQSRRPDWTRTSPAFGITRRPLQALRFPQARYATSANLWIDGIRTASRCFGETTISRTEFATAVQYDIPAIMIVLDNGMYGTIRMHQERHYPGRISATPLRNPDFAALARDFGGFGERIERTDDFAPAFERALDLGKPAILHCIVDPQALTPTATLDDIRRQGESPEPNR